MRHKSGFDEFTARLRAFIAGRIDARAPGTTVDQSQFDQFALELFALQYDQNAVYRKFCDSRGVSPQTIEHWTQIPAVPTQAFKEFDVSCLAIEERTSVFYSSGTTEQRPSRHFHNAASLAVYETSLLTWFQACVDLSGQSHSASRQGTFLTGDWQLAILTPPPHQAPNSSLVHMFDTIRRWMGAPESAFLAQAEHDGAWKLDLEATVRALKRCSAATQPVLVLGPAFSFVHLLDHLSFDNLAFALPAGSHALETGGYKGRSREVSREDLHALITERLGIGAERILGEYGMSELSSQAYDRVPTTHWPESNGPEILAPLSPPNPGNAGAGSLSSSGGEGRGEEAASIHQTPDSWRGATTFPRPSRLAHRLFHFPPWARAELISPQTGQPVAEGETGLIRVFDLANVYSVIAIQTEDLGIRHGSGFELLGRAAFAEPRGCSLMVA